MAIWLRLGCPAGLLWLILVSTAQAEPLRIAHTIWVGFGPLFVAEEKGFFASEGVEVELIRIEEHTTQYAGLSSGQIDAAAAAFQDAPVFSDPDEPPLVCVLMLDESRGADGILAMRDIRTIAELKGRSVAVLHGSVSHFYLSVVLTEAGLTQADLKIVDLNAEDAGEAFMMQEVDAAVTWSLRSHAQMPIQLATEFELVVNLRTAQALGLDLPRSILLRADEVIE